MGLKLFKKRYQNDGAIAEYLFGSLQDSITLEFEFLLEDLLGASDDEKIIAGQPVSVANTSDNLKTLTFQESNYFAEADINESYNIVNDNGGATFFAVEEVVDGNTVKMTSAFSTYSEFGDGYSLANVTEYNQMTLSLAFSEAGTLFDSQIIKYKFNIVEEEDIGEVVTGSIVGEKYTDIGTFQLTRMANVTPYIQKFKITGTFRIPEFLKQEWVDNGINKSTTNFNGETGFKFSASINILSLDNSKVRYNLDIAEDVVRIKAYGKKQDFIPKKFNITDLTYTTNTGVQSALDLNKQTTVSFKFNSDIPLVVNDCEVTFLVFESVLQNQIQDLDKNYQEIFFFDAISDTTTPANIGSPIQSFFSNLSISNINANDFTATFVFENGVNLRNQIKNNDLKYMLCVSGKFNGYYNRQIIDIANFIETLPSNELFEIQTEATRHPYSGTSAYNANDFFVGEDCGFVSIIKIEKDNPVYINRIAFSLVAIKNGKEIILDKDFINVSGGALDGDGRQIFNYEKARNLNLELDQQIYFKNDSEDSGYLYFTSFFPSIISYKEWESILGLNTSIPNDVLNPTAIGSGLVNQFIKYARLGYAFYYRQTIDFVYNFANYEQKKDYQFFVSEYNNPVYPSKSIKFFDPQGVELINGTQRFMQENCKIEVLFEKPNDTVHEGQILIYPTGLGGYVDANRSSTIKNLNNALFKDILKLKKTETGNILKIEGVLQKDIPDGVYDVVCFAYPLTGIDDIEILVRGTTDDEIRGVDEDGSMFNLTADARTINL